MRMIGFSLVLLFSFGLYGLSYAGDPFNPKGFSHKIRKSEVRHDYYPGSRIKVAIARVHDNQVLDTPFGKHAGGVSAVAVGPDGTAKIETPNQYDTRKDEQGYSKRIRELLSYHLSSVKCFQMVEREDINAIVREWDFGDTKYVKKTKQAAVELPDFIAQGFMTTNDGSCNRDDEVRAAWGLNKKRNGNRLLFLLRLYATDTSFVKLIACGTGNTAADTVESAVKDLKKRRDLLLPTVRVISTTADSIQIDGGLKQGLAPGIKFYLVRSPGAKESIDYESIEYISLCQVTELSGKKTFATVKQTFANETPKKGDIVFYYYPEEQW